jgi:TolB protein
VWKTYLALVVGSALGFLSCRQRESSSVSPGTQDSDYNVAYWTGVWDLGSIRSVSLNGSERALLADSLAACDSALSWSRDGSKILFASGWQIYVINSDGTQLKRLSSDSSKDAFAVWSPEGLRVAYQSEQGGKTEIYVMLRDGIGKQRLTNSARGGRMPSWSPDGGRGNSHHQCGRYR